MMAPHHERLRVLHEALDCAGALLDEPIDRLEVGRRTIEVGAGSRSVTVAYEYVNAYDGRGNALPGSGHWSVVAGPVRTGIAGRAARPLRFLARLWK
ncbi:MAG: hypothetical protein U1E23_03525 [Reyranellaceae bacterium]